MLRLRYSILFSRSNRRRPASTTVIERLDRSSRSFFESIAALIPPPMIQTSLSRVGTRLTSPAVLAEHRSREVHGIGRGRSVRSNTNHSLHYFENRSS